MNADKEKWILLVILSIIWGSSFILIKKSLEHFNPFQVGSLRVLIAGIILLPVAISNYKLFPKKHLKWLILAAFTGNFIPMFLFPIAETEVSSSIAGIINSMMPIFVIIVGALVWKFETTKKQIIGTFISFTGVCILAFGGGDSGEFKLIPILLLLLATLCYALSTTTVKSKLMEVSSTVLSAFVFSFVLFFPSVIALTSTGFFSEFNFSKDNMLGLLFVSLLSIFGTGLAMMMNYRLLKVSTPLFASTVTLVMPIVAIIWGIIDGEKLTYLQFIGAGIIIGGLIFLRANPKK
ncbi:DMT family transporter [Chryseobacterium arthrosphaerae]|uniref:DMT family transporter n=1 Tax=Chryseobacterium arthrosphaerae TaxID=651561 RepID=A0A1B8ZHX1_9FLAO|nr:DMT family transporter [Chryseobacterium arthrosphaerae]AYZ14357.1 EamA family transporter [Chryseobacterium arthrosphaerae]MDG4651449.1 DMT family transporter [Chryseobacterium arthrosphaerae]OCA71191.1 multidrug DMT transporter permease [Chryseobacterium arthrosphaerae]QUY55184.1 EamA family transporter [Chryseobacterium arthrosphaerae]RTZ50279.1 EamA family transporter [Chryseobacterium arthrosphaerae]